MFSMVAFEPSILQVIYDRYAILLLVMLVALRLFLGASSNNKEVFKTSNRQLGIVAAFCGLTVLISLSDGADQLMRITMLGPITACLIFTTQEAWVAWRARRRRKA